MENSQIFPEWLDPEWLDALERKHLAPAKKEIEAREKAGLEVTPEWLDALERKYMALAQKEIA
jgi:hypothetical protein